ncbi:hypothetical protein RFG22_09650, partial [Streptococcus ruminantium]|nr:hypothetical protein [Streptococcus ruminantium]
IRCLGPKSDFVVLNIQLLSQRLHLVFSTRKNRLGVVASVVKKTTFSIDSSDFIKLPIPISTKTRLNRVGITPKRL